MPMQVLRASFLGVEDWLSTAFVNGDGRRVIFLYCWNFHKWMWVLLFFFSPGVKIGCYFRSDVSYPALLHHRKLPGEVQITLGLIECVSSLQRCWALLLCKISSVFWHPLPNSFSQVDVYLFFFFFLRKRIFTWQRGRYRIWQNLGGVGEALC